MSDVVNDPDFAQSFVITRDSGQFILGVWNQATTQVQGYGIIQPATAEEIAEVPEADRISGMVSFHSSDVIYETHSGGSTSDGVSDTILWQGQNYRICKVYPWEDFGYFKAIGARMSGK